MYSPEAKQIFPDLATRWVTNSSYVPSMFCDTRCSRDVGKRQATGSPFFSMRCAVVPAVSAIGTTMDRSQVWAATFEGEQENFLIGFRPVLHAWSWRESLAVSFPAYT